MRQKKLNEENALRWKEKKEKIKQDKKIATEKHLKSLLEPNIKNNSIVWIDKNKNGSLYEGRLDKDKLKMPKKRNEKDEHCFEIKRGMSNFSLKITNDSLLSEKRTFCSTQLVKLQEIANRIIHDNI